EISISFPPPRGASVDVQKVGPAWGVTEYITETPMVCSANGGAASRGRVSATGLNKRDLNFVSTTAWR
ncbi:MAG: hypothetical protein Q8L38_03940, partial [Pseudohongiella sp.]|nr:hypothetical protein [Pseudohongiella sp.]